MKRRDFNKSIAALFAIPALPANSAVAQSSVVANATHTPSLYAWGAKIAETHGRCSTDMLARMLHIDASNAKELFDSLIRTNAVGPANALGMSTARNAIPSATGINPVAKTNLAGPRNTPRHVEIKQIREQIGDAIHDEEVDAAPEQGDVI